MKMTNTLPQRMKRIRCLRNMSQGDLAEKCGMNRVQVSHYECGQRAPGVDRLVDICKALEVSADYLIGLTEEHESWD